MTVEAKPVAWMTQRYSSGMWVETNLHLHEPSGSKELVVESLFSQADYLSALARAETAEKEANRLREVIIARENLKEALGIDADKCAVDAAVQFKKAEKAALSEAAALREEIERLEDTMKQIDDWCEAYPLTVFPEPDLKKAAELLKAGGITLDAVSASAMRHVLSTLPKMIRNSLKGGDDE